MVEIRHIWRSNLEEEFVLIRKLATKYRYVVLESLFPGIVARPLNLKKGRVFDYQLLKDNVDILKLLQMGFAFLG